MSCNKNIEIKQGTTFSLSVDFTGTGFSLDDVERIEFMFKKQRSKDADDIKANVYKSDGTGDSTRIPNTNIILVPFTETDTYLFDEGQVFYMDTKIYMTGSTHNPPTNIVEIMMSDTLFDGSFPGPSVIPLDVTENGTYTAPLGKSYNPVNVNVEFSTIPLDVTENGVYTPPEGQAYDTVTVNVPTVDETEYTATTKLTTKRTYISFSNLLGNPREWYLVPDGFPADSYSTYYINGGNKTNNGAIMYVCHGSMSGYDVRPATVTPGYSDGVLTIPSVTGISSGCYYRANVNYVLHYKL